VLSPAARQLIDELTWRAPAARLALPSLRD
jgi:nitrous oxidase accessory protein NosD